MDIDKDKVFQQSRLTHRLEILADEAIKATDPLFMEKLGCSIREMRVLRMIDDHPGIAFNEIMHITGLDRSLVSRLIRSLLEKKLIDRVNSEQDARRYGLFTTAVGKEYRAQGRVWSDAAEALLWQPLEPNEVATLNVLLSKLLVWVRTSEYQTGVQGLYEIIPAKSKNR
ncbi:MAG: MarR family winged helix-turn-helix transcriptional regulator [Thiolinea sp.]